MTYISPYHKEDSEVVSWFGVVRTYSGQRVPPVSRQTPESYISRASHRANTGLSAISREVFVPISTESCWLSCRERYSF